MSQQTPTRLTFDCNIELPTSIQEGISGAYTVATTAFQHSLKLANQVDKDKEALEQRLAKLEAAISAIQPKPE